MKKNDKNFEGEKNDLQQTQQQETKQEKQDLKEKQKLKVNIPQQEYEELKKKADEKDEIWDKYLRLYAEYENSKKMWEKHKEELLKFGNFRILREFINILDELEAALSHLKEDKEHLRGVNIIYKKIKDVLSKEGLKLIDAKGKTFNPYWHEALSFEERQDLPEHTVIEVIQKGYSFEDKVLRPAKVKVSVRKSAEERTENKEQNTDENIKNSNL